MASRISSKGKAKADKSKPTEQYRREIEARTALGESCAQIAAALQAQGVNISSTTISRRRLEWGLNKNVPHKAHGARKSKTQLDRSIGRAAGASARRVEIETRTRNGQSAEQIADALLAQGWKLERGASTVMRLQTVWGLVPRDPDRPKARSQSRASAPRVKQPELPTTSKREQEREANREQQSSTMHYPTNCSFGPKKRAREDYLEDPIDTAADFTDYGPLYNDTSPTPPASQQDDTASLHDISAEIMSVDILIDLATSTLSAANNLKEMLLAHQGQRTTQKGRPGIITTLNDLANARKKVREAAGLMLDLATDPGA